jgi:general secretion pathway protein E
MEGNLLNWYWPGLFASVIRGPGYYYDPIKLLCVVGIYFAWLRTCWWADRDCRQVGLDNVRWTCLLLVAGVLGLLAVWALPQFLGGFLLLLILYLAPSLWYALTRNALVEEEDKVLTPHHFRKVIARLTGSHVPELGKGRRGGHKIVPVRFIGRNQGGEEPDDTRVARAQESPHYRAALELVYEAITKRATDIHLEPTRDEMTVRFRIDGILQPIRPMDRQEGDAVLNIYKVLAKLDITEKRKPQDGAFSAEVQTPAEKDSKAQAEAAALGIEEPDDKPPRLITRQVDFRVATAGSVVGEKMVMRLLDRSRAIGSLNKLGMRDRIRDQIRSIVSQPHGLFIVCGPTGAGKSTTLYACLNEIDRYQRNVITIENPVEYHIDNVTQIEINPKAGKTFATELRSILRQDPDVIYVGEVRDQETAEIACQAAQTGHMVFTTLHANDTATAVARLLDLGVQPFLVASALSGILGQRLVRTLCPHCKVAYRPDPELLRRANLPADKIKVFYRPPKRDEEDSDEPCSNCNGTGYRGRTGIFELLVVTERIRELIKENPNIDAIRKEAVRAGMKTLAEDGLRAVIEGETSIDEMLRVAK